MTFLYEAERLDALAEEAIDRATAAARAAGRLDRGSRLLRCAEADALHGRAAGLRCQAADEPEMPDDHVSTPATIKRDISVTNEQRFTSAERNTAVTAAVLECRAELAAEAKAAAAAEAHEAAIDAAAERISGTVGFAARRASQRQVLAISRADITAAGEGRDAVKDDAAKLAARIIAA